MSRQKGSYIERAERHLVQLIQQPGADKGKSLSVRMLLFLLFLVSQVFRLIVAIRAFFYDVGVLRRFTLGCQVISIGNVTAGGTGKTPITELFAHALMAQGRKPAILSRGYRRKEKPWWQRLFSDVVEPPLAVSDGKRVLLDAVTGGDEPHMLATNLLATDGVRGTCVVVDRNRVKAGRWAVNHYACDVLILDDGFQYKRLKHSLEVVLVDSTNPFGNGHMLPRGVLREPASHIACADYIFLTKCSGDVSSVIQNVRDFNKRAKIITCRHAPRVLRDVWSCETRPLEWLKGKRLATLSGIAVPQGFEDSLRKLGAEVVVCKRYADHHRYDSAEIIQALRRAQQSNVDALITTEKDAVRFPRIATDEMRVPAFYLRIDVEILSGEENFREAIDYICHRRVTRKDAGVSTSNV